MNVLNGSSKTLKSSLSDFESFFKTDVAPEELSIDSLSFVGDAVYSLYFRIKTLRSAKRRTGYQHNLTLLYVEAKGQRKALEAIEQFLSEEERIIVRRGYNSRGAKRRGDDRDYKCATALEALVGYLFLKRRYGRLEELLEKVENDVSSWKERAERDPKT